MAATGPNNRRTEKMKLNDKMYFVENIHKGIETAIIDHSSNSQCQSLFVCSRMTEQPQTLQG